MYVDTTLPKIRYLAQVLVTIAIVTMVALLASLIPGMDVAQAAEQRTEPPGIRHEKSIPGKDFVPGKQDRSSGSDRNWKAPDASWPTGKQTERIAAASAPTSAKGRAAALDTGPVSVRQADDAPAEDIADTGLVEIEVLDRKAAEQAGVNGVLFTVTPTVPLMASRARSTADAPPSGKAEVKFNYRDFEGSFGANWGSRLELIDTATGKSLTQHNDTSARQLTGEIDLPETRAGRAAQPVALAAVARAAGSGGDYSATSLSPSGSWMGGSSSGGFSWTYPVDAPEVPGGPEPEVALGYSSQAIDGRTASTNAQSSWIAEGWDYEPGFIERRYRSCSDDQGTGANNPGQAGKTGDLCFGSDQMVMSLGGSSTELVKDDTSGAWRPADDDGSRLERKTGAENGARGGEYWVLTTTDGTQYHFGLNKLPGAAAQRTNSTLTVPVAGNHSGEPCYASAFADSFCDQGWRWMLDYVVDPRGDAMSLWWTKESNHYGKNNKPAGVKYDRGAYLKNIDYGQRSDKLFTQNAAARITFTVAERCIPGSGFSCAEADRTPANARHWPDTPIDQQCNAGAQCKDKNSPTFWSTKRLTKITTQVNNGGFKNVDSFTLDQSFPATGDGTSPALWLKSIERTGHGQDGTTATMPKVTFRGEQMDNRVDGFEGLEPFSRYRIHAVDTENGGTIGVTYSPQQCKRGGTMPASPHTNTLRCYPQVWTPKGALEPITDYFHKYLVTQVREEDNVTDAVAKVTSYEYLGGAAWAYDDSENTEAKRRTWSQYRGYERVRTRLGSGTDVKQLTENRYFRGMHGDKLPSGTRSVEIEDSEGGKIADRPEFQGQLREEITYASDGGAIAAATKLTPSAVKTAERKRTGTTPLQAYMVSPVKSETREHVKDTTWRRSSETTTYDSAGLPTEVEETTPSGKKACTRIEYARNTAKHILDTESREVTTTGACGAPGGKVIDDTRSLYDGGVYKAAPTRGLVTEVQELNAAGDGHIAVDRTEYDIHGRETKTFDVEGDETRITFTPATGAVPTKQVDTDPLGHTETTEFDQRGLPTAEIDANGKRVDMRYDPLGRLLKVWDIDRNPATQSPSAEYDYTIRRDGPTVVTNRTLKDDGSYATSYEILDGLLRTRQTQDAAVGGEGRIVSDTFYDSVGRTYKSNDGYFNDQNVAPSLLTVGDNVVPSQTRVVFNGLGEETSEVTYHYGDEKLRSTTVKDGDAVTVTPPKGETVTTTYQDTDGRDTRLREYTKADRSAWQDTTYGYDDQDQLTKVTEPGGGEHTFTYDARGRQTSATDPDGGTTRFEYDRGDNLTTVVDARGNKLVTTFDKGGRPTSLRENSATGPKRLEWTYDSLGKGLPVASIRYDKDGNAYRDEVTAYDANYRPRTTKTTIPATAGKAAGEYTYTYAYTSTGNLSWVELPKVGPMAKERLVFRYNRDDLPISISGAANYVTDVTYSKYGEILRSEAGPAGKKLFSTYFHNDFTRRTDRVVHDRSVQPGRIDDTTYSYDEAGNVTGISRTPGPGMPDAQTGTDTQCFAYDQLRRMTSAWTAREKCAADGPSRATVGGPEAYWQSYEFDASGNRTKLVEHDPTGNAAKDITRTYSYGGDAGGPNRLREITSTGADGTTRSTFGYDTAGNTTTRQNGGTTQSLTWDIEGNLESVTEPLEGGGEKKTSYFYGASGERLLRTGADGATTLYLGETELTVKADGTESVQRSYAHPDGATTVRSSDGGREILLADHHGSTQASVDMVAAGMPVTRRLLTPFGEDRGAAPSTWPGYRGFVGGTRDQDTGLTQLGARPYDPATGRFLSVDPMVDYEQPATINPYAYSNNAPATFSDPDGLFFPILIGIAARIAIQAAIRAAARRAAQIAARKAAEALRKRLLAEARKRAIAAARKKAAAKAKREAARKAAAAKRAAAKRAAQRAAAKRAAARQAAARAKQRAQRAAAKRAQAARAAARKAKPKPRPQPKSQPRPRSKPSQKAKPAQQKKASPKQSAGSKAREEIKSEARGQAEEAVTEQVGCPSNSFVPGTLVVMADGTRKPIEDVKLGDKVLATDPKTGETTAQPVVATILGDGAKNLVKVTVRTGDAPPGNIGDAVRASNRDDHGVPVDTGLLQLQPDNNGNVAGTATGTVVATDGHPFWVPALGEWVDADDLEPGQRLQSSTGSWLQITAVQAWTQNATVHNLTIADTHTYYVLARKTPVLVHNSNCPWTSVRKYDGDGHPVDGTRIPTNDALNAAEKWLGRGYREPVPGSGRYVSRSGTRVARMGESDITGQHGGGPHMNFERLAPNPKKPGKMMVTENRHIYLE
ncbi:polymorphic toxin-type HINT domain-containing protein [Streptomyces sp. NPDC057554]|uniref:polymorphic toxin-type HINT domain-containing protein n=1 Tax=Streptomyces sp. NPDC057554 TaxID=3350538 RepID=UPI0036B3D7D8